MSDKEPFQDLAGILVTPERFGGEQMPGGAFTETLPGGGPAVDTLAGEVQHDNVSATLASGQDAIREVRKKAAEDYDARPHYYEGLIGVRSLLRIIGRRRHVNAELRELKLLGTQHDFWIEERARIQKIKERKYPPIKDDRDWTRIAPFGHGHEPFEERDRSYPTT